MLAAIHPVRDFETWKESAKQLMAERSTAGRVSTVIYQSADDPNEVLVAIEFENEDDALATVPNWSMREILDRAGIDIYPAVFVGHEVTELTVEHRPD
jgi:hypothetical protein